MLLDVKFRYAAKLIPFQKRNETTVHFIDSVPVMVRELADVEAPVAFRYVDPDQHAWDKDNIPAVAKLDVRLIDGVLYEPYCRHPSVGSEWIRLDAAALASAAEGDVGQQQGYTENVLGTATHAYRIHDSRPEDFPRSRFVSDERQARIDAIHARAARLILVDGNLYRRTTEPVYALRMGHLSVQRLSRVQADKARFSSIYRADELEQIHEAHRRGWNETSTIEVVDPAAITYRGPSLALFELASSILEGLKSGIPDATVERFARYAALRDILAEAERIGATAEDATVQAIMPVLEEIRRLDIPEDSYNQGKIAEVSERLDADSLRSLDLSESGVRP